MIGNVLTKVFGSKNERVLKQIQPLVNRINELESSVSQLDDTALAGKTVEFKQRVAQGEPLDDLIAESFAVMRDASRRVLGERHFDVQLLGGVVLHRGNIAEMKTGEGKTLTSTLAVYLNSLSGKGVHVVTVNDYLATRDAEWMGQVYRFLGMSVGRIVHDMGDQQRREAYQCRCDLRNQQRVRLRLSAGQYEVRPGRFLSARIQLRHCRRGRLNSHRRSKNSADHLRSGRHFHGVV